MAVKVNDTFVDEVYSTIFVENLRPNSFLVEGLTYTSKYEKGDPKAGVVWFHKLDKTAIGADAVGKDYSSVEQTNTLIPVYLSNAFRNSKKLRGVTLDQINAPFLDQTVSEQAKDIRVGVDKTAIACLKFKGEQDANTDTITADTILATLIGMKKDLRKKNVTPKVMLISPEIHATLLEAQLTKQVFTPETNDELIKAGSVGRYLGMSVFERPELGDVANTAVVYYDDAKRTVDISLTDIIMYDPEYFGKVDSFQEARLVASEKFAGTLANVEDNMGFGVMDANAVLVRNHLGA